MVFQLRSLQAHYIEWKRKYYHNCWPGKNMQRCGCKVQSYNGKEWSGSHATHSWQMFDLSKNKLHWNQKTKYNVILRAGSAHRGRRWMRSLSSSCLVQPGEESVYHGNTSPGQILSICSA
jgi:hypothetical protein